MQEWLKLQGDGYRKAVKNAKSIPAEKGYTSEDHMGVRSIKKRYPLYYWPEILLENIVRNSNKKQQEEIKNIVGQLDKMKEKTELFLMLKKLMKS